MSYPDVESTPTNQPGIGVNQPQSGLDYPLVKPAENVRNIIADFYLAYDDLGEYGKGPVTKFPLQIKYLLGAGENDTDLPAGAPVPVHASDIVVVDAAGTEILNTATAEVEFASRDWGSNYRIYEWITPDAVCQLVIYTPQPQTAQHIAPDSAVLDARVVHKLPKRLRSLSVRAKNSDVTSGPYFGDVYFKNGYNTEITTSPTTTEQLAANTNINFSAEAGTGDGYFPECGAGYDENDVPIPRNIKTINGVAPTTGGDFLLSAGDCLYTRPRLDDEDRLDHSKLAIGADCTPCCKCTDYVQTAEYMNSIAALYKVIGDRVQAAKLAHFDNIEAFNQKRACAINNPLKLVIVPQCCPEVDVVLMLCNSCQTCYPESTLILKLTTPTIFEPTPNDDTAIVPDISVVCGSVTARNPAGTTANNVIDVTNLPPIPPTNTPDTPTSKIGAEFTVNLPPVPAGSSTFIKFRMRVNDEHYRTSQFTGELSGEFIDNTVIQMGCSDETTNADPAVVSKVFILNCSNVGVDQRCIEQ